MRARRNRTIVLLFVVLVAACSGTRQDISDAAVPPDSATDGVTRVPAIFTDHGIYVHATFNGVTLLMQLDTGSPMAILDPDLAVAKGVISADQVPPPKSAPRNLDVTIGDRPIGARPTVFEHLPLFGEALPDLPEPIAGLIGNAVFYGHVLGLDPRDHELWISDATTPDVAPPVPANTGVPLLVSIGRKLDYLQVPCAFADTPSKLCFFDTGAPDTLVFDRYWNQLAPHPSDRTVPFEFGDATGKVRDGYYQRAKAAKIGDTVVVPGEFALVGNFDWFDSFCTGQISPDCVGIVGMHEVVGYHTAIDYENNRIVYSPYQPPTVPPDPFVGFPFLLDESTSGFVVHAVVPNSGAVPAGIMAGDTLVTIDAQPVASASLVWAVPGYLAGAPGAPRSFGFTRGTMSYTVSVAAEDLLPSLP